MRSERKKQIYLHFSEPQGRKAHAVGLKRKAELTPNRGQRLLADYAEVRRKKSLRSRIKAENFEFFGFRLLFHCAIFFLSIIFIPLR